MRVGITVKFPDYENIRLDSSEHPSVEACNHELIEALNSFHLRMSQFDSIFKTWFERLRI